MTIALLPDLAAAFILIFARLGTLVMLMPAIGDRSVPVRIRLVFALVMTVLFYPVAFDKLPDIPDTLMGLAVLGAGEMLVGFVIGMSARLILASLQIAGTTIAFQMGMGFALSFDPSQGAQGALIGTFLSLLGLTLILTTDLHYLFIAALVDSYVLFTPGQVLPTGDVLQAALEIFTRMFTLSAQLAAPFIVFGLVFYLGLGVLARLMPQIQIFFIALPANILVGFILFAIVLTAVSTWFLGSVEQSISPFVVR